MRDEEREEAQLGLEFSLQVENHRNPEWVIFPPWPISLSCSQEKENVLVNSGRD